MNTGTGLKQKLVITLTTVYGSHQYTLGQAAKYLFVLFLLLAGLSFFVSNSLLMITSSDLDELEADHQQLLNEYTEISDSQQLFLQQKSVLDKALDDLKLERDKALGDLQQERDSLQQANSSLSEQNQRFARAVARLGELETILGLSGEGKNTAERLENLHQVAEERRYLLHQIPSGMPLEGKPVVTAGFGMRNHPVHKKRIMHPAVDFRARTGTPVYATADAVVEYGGFHKKSGFGKLIILQHNFGFKTYFAHLDKVLVRTRQFVRKGQLIGYSGNTGVSTGPHLHYEVRHMFKKLDPKPFLAMNISNVNETFTAVKNVEWASLRKLYPLSLNAPQ